MKTTQKRVWAILSALMMLFSILGGIVVLPVQAATVNYVYSGNYVYNWGERDELATFLSPMAEDFYADNSVTYDKLSAFSGSSTTSSVPYSALFGELHELMYGNLDHRTTYAETRDLYMYTDCQNSAKDTDVLSSFYSGEDIGPDWDSGKTWNREHCWPNSKSNSGSSYTDREEDIMMLRPTTVDENTKRSNTPYGESSGYYDPNGLGQKVRGDAARVLLYVYVCWGGSSNDHDGALDKIWDVMESKDVLLKWMEEDPVDTWEMGRNDSVEAITGTRNVFVDYPELAFLLFNEDVPTDYDSPSGEGAGPAYTITASTNNSTYGTVSVSGKIITATPKTGYAVSGYTILSGKATVTRNGNVFTVAPTSDVSIRINFAKQAETTVQFVGLNGTTTQTAYVGDNIDLPAHSGAVPEGYTFLGWSEQNVEETETAPTYLTAGSSYTVSAGAILYALYSRLDSEGGGNINSFEPYSGTLTEGDYIIVYQKGAMKAEVSSDRLTFDTVSTDAGSIDNPADAIVWHIAKDGNNWTIYNTSAGVYAAGNGTKNKAALVTSVTDFAKWTATGNGTYEFVNVGNKAKSVNANLRRNGTYGYACYSTSTGGALTLYKRQSGTMYYLTACEHTYSSAITTPATCTKDGVCTYTCSICGDSYTEAIPATSNHTYGDDFDTDCDLCGAVRQLNFGIFSDNVTNSRMEMDGGTGGLAFAFNASVSGVQKNKDNSVVWDDAKVIINGEEYRVVAMGAVVTNNEAMGTDPEQMIRENAGLSVQSVDIEAVYMTDIEAENCTYAVRIINIPQIGFDNVVYARPYYVVEHNGEKITLYEDIASATYNG